MLRPQVNAVAAAPAVIRSGVVDPAFSDEAESWLKATELWGQAMQRALVLLAALDAGHGATAWTERQQITTLINQAKAIRDSRAPHNGTYPRIGERVVDELLAEVGRVHDRWLGVVPGRTATTSLGTYQDNVPARMVDGDPNTFFWSNGSPGPGAEVRVDLGDSTEISDIALHEPKVEMPVEVDTAITGVLGEVEYRDGVATVQQRGHQVRSDEAVAAGHDDIGHSFSFVYVSVCGCRSAVYRPIPL